MKIYHYSYLENRCNWKLIEKIDNNKFWNHISRYQEFSEEFIYYFINKLQISTFNNQYQIQKAKQQIMAQKDENIFKVLDSLTNNFYYVKKE